MLTWHSMCMSDVVDGVGVYACTTDEQVIDLVKGGQAVFGIALGRVFTDLSATLHQLPAEPPASSQRGEGDARPALRIVN